MWDEYLIREIVEKRCVICIGSGLSSQSKNAEGKSPIGWYQLLKELNQKLVSDYETKQIVEGYIEKSRYLDAAEIIAECASTAEFSRLVKSYFIEPRFIPSDAHNMLLDIAPKIVITPNYDCIIEQAYENRMGRGKYSVINYTADTLLDKVRSPEPIIIKNHGCADADASKIILSRSGYYELRKTYGSFFEIVKSIMQLNTVLFIGCGLEDPDLNLILENNTISIKTNFQNYALIGGKSVNIPLQNAYKRQYNLRFVTYEQSDGTDHSNFIKAIEKLKEQVLEMRIKFGMT